jgi:hypothetical protein
MRFFPQAGFAKKAREYEFADKKDPDAGAIWRPSSD